MAAALWSGSGSAERCGGAARCGPIVARSGVPGRRCRAPAPRLVAGRRRAASGARRASRRPPAGAAPPAAPGRRARPRRRLTRRARRLGGGARPGRRAWRSGPGSGRSSPGWRGRLRLAGESSVVVQSGDTLWSIAALADGDGDVRAVVDEIRELNAWRVPPGAGAGS